MTQSGHQPVTRKLETALTEIDNDAAHYHLREGLQCREREAARHEIKG